MWCSEWAKMGERFVLYALVGARLLCVRRW